MKWALFAPLAVLIPVAATAGAQTRDDRAAAKSVVAARGDAIVTVMGTLKARMTQAGRDKAGPDQAVHASAAVLTSSGLTVLALSAIDPGNLLTKNPTLARAKMNITTELVDLKLRLANGTELPARIALRDSDLDLLFVIPETAPGEPMTALDGASARLSALDPVVIVQRFGELTGWKVAAALGTVEVVVDKPRTFYMIAMTTTGNGIGASIFDIKGQFAGLVTLRSAGDSRNNALTGMKGDALQTLGMVPVVIPAADILDIAKQAIGK
jgi:hypothetical protein